MEAGKSSAAPPMESDSDSADGAQSKAKRNYFADNIGKVTFDHNGKVLAVKEPNLNQKIVHPAVSIDTQS